MFQATIIDALKRLKWIATEGNPNSVDPTLIIKIVDEVLAGLRGTYCKTCIKGTTADYQVEIPIASIGTETYWMDICESLEGTFQIHWQGQTIEIADARIVAIIKQVLKSRSVCEIPIRTEGYKTICETFAETKTVTIPTAKFRRRY